MDLWGDVRSAVGAVADRALDLALPATCAGCGREGSPLCTECLPALDARLEAQPGVPVGLPADLPAPLLQLEWCAPFTGVTRRALHALKYDGERRLARPLGAAVARRWARAGVAGDVLVPVPASPDRVRDRGYDQAALIAGEVGRRLGLPVGHALQRTRATTAQFDLDRAARATNLGGAFAIGDAAGVVGRWVVLLDDVVTTGATLAACAIALLEGGATAVSAVAVARER
ncbi:MAG TPA: ComF family protein [Candidatus Dormibacteraeota bacterium]|nr:ComF family protein [Candidatus Dormibacteraeota bacterium]